MTDHTLISPSAVVVGAARAGFWRRGAALVVDGLLLSIVQAVIESVVGPSGITMLVTVASVAYFAVLEGTTGQTIGKQLLKIRVVDEDAGRPIGIARGVLRQVARALSVVVVFLGYLWMLWDPNKQTWHDKLASSVVVPAAVANRPQ
jgi:uncharacterized RDD family membrane protein YckC